MQSGLKSSIVSSASRPELQILTVNPPIVSRAILAMARMSGSSST
jgi:hypothetical protein